MIPIYYANIIASRRFLQTIVMRHDGKTRRLAENI